MFSRFTIQTRLSSVEAEEVLRRMIRPRRAFRTPDSPAADSRPFEGRIENGSFTFRRVITGRNSFMPIVTGRVTQAEGGAVVHGRMRVAVSVALVMAVWTGGAITVAVQEVLRDIRDHNLFAAVAVSFLPIFGVLLIGLGFYPERNKALRLLTDALESGYRKVGESPSIAVSD